MAQLKNPVQLLLDRVFYYMSQFKSSITCY